MFKTKRGVKRAVSLLLTFCMVFSLITVNGSTVSAKETSCELTEGDYNYIELSDGTVEITKYISTADNLEMGETYELIIPSTLGGKNVTSIGKNAFSSCRSFSSVIIPDTVTNLSDSAFIHCHEMEVVHLPANLVTIGDSAFWDCAFTNLSIPATVESIGGKAFSAIDELTNITVAAGNTHYCTVNNVLFRMEDGVKTELVQFPIGGTSEEYAIPSGIKKICGGAFMSSGYLESVTIPEGVTYIGDNAFRECSRIETISIPSTVTAMGYIDYPGTFNQWTFHSCDQLTAFYVSENNQYFSSTANGILFDKNKTSILLYPCKINNTSYTIPDTVTCIGEYAFAENDSLVTVTIPNVVQNIGKGAFQFCYSLASIVIPNGVKTLGYDMFYACSSLTSATIPSSVTEISDSAFEACASNLTIYGYAGSCAATYASENSITFSPLTCNHSYTSKITKQPTCTEDGVKAYTCSACGNSYTEPVKATGHTWNTGKVTKEATAEAEGVKTYTCERCLATKTEAIPKLATQQGQQGETEKDKKDTTITSGDKVEDTRTNATYKVKTDGTVEYIAPKAEVKKVVVPATITVGDKQVKVTSVDTKAFAGNKKITSVIIGDNITSVSNKAFKGCTKLATVKMGSGIKSIGKETFSGCKALTSVTIGSNVTTIGDKAFKGCTKLSKVTITKKVTKIDKNAFDGCKKLKTITIKSTKLKTVGKNALKGINKKAIIKVPKNQLSKYKKLFKSSTGFKKTMKIKK